MKIIFYLFTLLILSFSITSSGQKNFTKGYVRIANGDSLSGYINYQNWRNIPDKIHFRKSSSSQSTVYQMNELLGFGVSERHYIRAIVAANISLDSPNELDEEPAPVLETDTCFLESLVMGEKSLFTYTHRNGKEQFYILDSGVYKLLIYKQYIVIKDLNKITFENKSYQNQLKTYLTNCISIDEPIRTCKFTRKQLVKLFANYLACISSNPNYITKTEKIRFAFGAAAGITQSSVHFKSNYHTHLTNAEFNASISPNLSVSCDIILPKNRQRLSIYNQLGYTGWRIKDQQGSSETELGVNTIKLINMLRYKLYKTQMLSVFIQAGLSNSYNMLSKNQTKANYPVGTIKKAMNEVRAYEQGYVLGAGMHIYKWGIQGIMERTNGFSPYISLQSGVHNFHILVSYQIN